jgi:prepilin-type N-terminal cleavage/methylation domain-containing protein
MKPVHSKREQGFTLTEMMVAVTVGALSMVLIFSSFLAISTSLAASSHYREMHHEVRHAIDLLRRDLTRGSGVSNFSASNLLTVTTAAGVSTNTISVAYTVASNQLFRTEGAGTPVMLATGVVNVVFTLYDASGAGTTSPSEAYSAGVKIGMRRQGVRTAYEDVLETRNRMRRKGL